MTRGIRRRACSVAEGPGSGLGVAAPADGGRRRRAAGWGRDGYRAGRVASSAGEVLHDPAGVALLPGFVVGGLATEVDEHMDELAPDVRVKVGKLLSQLEGDGYTWRVLDVARTVEEQTANVAAGFSRTMNSRHLGAPGAARAVDLEPVSTPDGAASTDELRAQAYIALRDAAPAYGLETGGAWSKDGGKWSAYGLGWDPGHVQEAL